MISWFEALKSANLTHISVKSENRRLYEIDFSWLLGKDRSHCGIFTVKRRAFSMNRKAKQTILIVFACYVMSVSASLAQNWFPTSAPSEAWTSVASTADGTRLIGVVGRGDQSSIGGIYVSTNSGATWAQTSAPLADWACAASSSDGMKLVVGSGAIFRSSDGGSTWSPTSAPGFAWTCIASSADGSVLVAGTYGGSVYVSNDSGNT